MRLIELTPKQAAAFWGNAGPLEEDEKLPKLQPDEKIVGIGSYGSSDPKDQNILMVDKK